MINTSSPPPSECCFLASQLYLVWSGYPHFINATQMKDLYQKYFTFINIAISHRKDSYSEENENNLKRASIRQLWNGYVKELCIVGNVYDSA